MPTLSPWNDCGLPSSPTTIAPCCASGGSRLRTISVSTGHLAHEPLGHRAELAVAHRAESEGAHDHQVVVLALDVVDQRLVVLAVHHPGLERQPGGLGLLPHHLEVRVGDELEAHRDQRVVDLSLALELVLVPVLLGQRVLHLLEAVVVEPRRVDVTARQRRAEGPAQLHGQVDGAVGVVRVVDRHVDLPEHESLLRRHRGRRRGHLSSNSTAISPFAGTVTSWVSTRGAS